MRNYFFKSIKNIKASVPKNILILSGASKLAEDLHLQLQSMGYHSEYITTRSIGLANTCKIDFLPDNLIWFKNAIRSFFYRNIKLKVVEKYAYFQDISETMSYYSLKRFKSSIKVQPDPIFVLFDYRLVTTLSIRQLYELTGAKIILLLPDMRMFTGGCSYAFECKGYQSNCSNCPAIGNESQKYFAEEILHQKMKNLEEVDYEVVTFSKEQFEQAGVSTLFKKTKRHQVFFPLDYTVFKYKNKNEAKKELGLSSKKKVLLFGAANIDEYRKGFRFSKQVIDRAASDPEIIRNWQLVIVGANDAVYKEYGSLASVSVFSFVPFQKLALLYQSADFFVCPTLADSGPTMINQSILCGTPVVGFPVGVAIDLIEHGKTGYLAEKNQPKLFVDLVFDKVLSLSEETLKNMSLNCRDVANKITQKDLYNKLNDILNG